MDCYRSDDLRRACRMQAGCDLGLSYAYHRAHRLADHDAGSNGDANAGGDINRCSNAHQSIACVHGDGTLDVMSLEGRFSVRYPSDYVRYEGRKPSVDGVLAQAPNTVALHRTAEPGFVLSIGYQIVDPGLSLSAFAQQDDPCVANSKHWV